MTQATTIDPNRTIDWLNKLVMMAQWKPALSFQAVKLVGDQTAYQGFLSEVRTGNTDDTDITDDTVRTAREELLQAVVSWPSLKEMFAADEDPFAGAPVEHLQLLAEVSDITTDPQKMVYSRNGTFLAVVEALRQSQELDAEPLVVDGLNKFFTLVETDEELAEMLYNLAEEPHWLVVMASLRDGRDYTRGEEAIVAQTLRDWQAKLTTELRALLFKPGHLSRAPTKLIRMAWNNQQLFQEARNSIPSATREQDASEERRQVANAALALFEEKAQVECEEVKADLLVLATVARHFINVRKFAKLDGFVYTWPDIARLAMSNYPALEYVEDLLVNRKPRPGDTELDAREARDLYELGSRNERLIRFLRLRPRFAEIDDDELRRYRPLAPVVITETTVQPPSGAARVASGSVDFPSPSPDMSPPPPPSPARLIENSVLEIVKDTDPAPPTDPSLVKYDVSLSGLGYTYSGLKLQIAIEKLLEQIRAAIGIRSDSELQAVLKDMFATSPTQAEARMIRGGGLLEMALFSSGMQEQLSKLLAKNEPLRVVVKSRETEVHYLPWEWLPDLSPQQLLLSTPGHSVVRQFAEGSEMPAGLLYSPLRLMSIIPPAPVGRRFIGDRTIKAFSNLATAGHNYLLAGEDATLEKIVNELKVWPPQVVHFEGHVTVSVTNPDVDALELFLAGGGQVSIEEFGRLLKDNGVQLLVIGRNSMAQMYQNIGARAAFQFAEQGLPAVIAPMRAIDDASATTFTSEFYQAFLQGNTLESALHLARRKLASKGGDWSVFALFADPARLDYFQLLRESA
jgi:hypothetical protein